MSEQIKAQAHLTITDLTDITDVYLEYCMAANSYTTAAAIQAKTTWTSPERDWSVVYPTWQAGYQIWIRQVQIKEGVDQPEYGTPYLDTAVNQINLSIGTINSDLQTRLKYFWDNLNNNKYPKGTYMAGGIENVTFDYEDPSTYGYNTHYANGIELRYNSINLTTLLHSGLSLYYPVVDDDNNIVDSAVGASLSVNALSFFQPPIINGSNVTQGNKTLELNGDSLSFYGSDPESPDAQLWSNGLTLQKGGITAGSYTKSNRGVAHITDAIEDGPIDFLSTTFTFTQSGSGEPSPTNVRNFTGVTETYLFKTNRNLLQRQGTTYPYTYRGITYTLNDDYSVTANGTATDGYSYCRVGASFVVREDCILTGCPTGGSNSTYELQLSEAGRIKRDYGEGVLLTPNDGKPEHVYIVIREGQTVENLTFYPMIRLATDLDSTYEYQALRYYRSFGNTYYKGTYDFISGTLTITHKIFDLTFAGASGTQGGSSSSNYKAFYSPVITGIKKPLNDETPDMYCNRAKVISRYANYRNTEGVAIHPTEGRIYTYLTAISSMSLADAQAWLEENPIQVVYPLENPEVIQLTGTTIKTYEGINNFWSRQGTISIEWGDFIYLSTDPYGPYTINDTEALDWKQIIGTNFGVRTDGSLYASNVDISGVINAESGSIGGFEIGNFELYSTNHSSPESDESGIYIGNEILSFGPQMTTYFTNTGTGKIGEWQFNNNEIKINEWNIVYSEYTGNTVENPDPSAQALYEYDNETSTYILTEDNTFITGKTYYVKENGDHLVQILLGVSGFKLSNTNTGQDELINFTLPSVDTNNSMSVNILDKILINNNQLTIIADAIEIKNRQNQSNYNVLDWILNTNTIATNNQSTIDTTIIPFINTYEQYISINTLIPYIYVGTNNFNTDIEITNAQINFKINGIQSMYMTSEKTHTQMGEFENLRMRTGGTNPIGNLTWIARSNGHLSLKVVN